MPEFEGRADVRDIAAIIGPERLRNVSHLVARVRDERNPRWRKKPTRQLPEPKGWREWSAAKWPNAIFNDKSSEFYAESWEVLGDSYKHLILTERAKEGAA